MQNWGERIFSNRQLRMRVYIKIVMIMVLEESRLYQIKKNLVVKSTMFLYRNIHKCTWTSPDGKTGNQIYHILIERRWHSSTLNV